VNTQNDFAVSDSELSFPF